MVSKRKASARTDLDADIIRINDPDASLFDFVHDLAYGNLDKAKQKMGYYRRGVRT